MQLLNAHFDHENVSLMGSVCEEVWRETLDRTFFITADLEAEARRRMVLHVMAAVAQGERDLAKLRTIALKGIEGADAEATSDH